MMLWDQNIYSSFTITRFFNMSAHERWISSSNTFLTTFFSRKICACIQDYHRVFDDTLKGVFLNNVFTRSKVEKKQFKHWKCSIKSRLCKLFHSNHGYYKWERGKKFQKIKLCVCLPGNIYKIHVCIHAVRILVWKNCVCFIFSNWFGQRHFPFNSIEKWIFRSYWNWSVEDEKSPSCRSTKWYVYDLITSQFYMFTDLEIFHMQQHTATHKRQTAATQNF